VTDEQQGQQKHAQHAEQQDEVEGHRHKLAENQEQGDEATSDDEVEAHKFKVQQHKKA
jgi:hypothetical protein